MLPGHEEGYLPRGAKAVISDTPGLFQIHTEKRIAMDIHKLDPHELNVLNQKRYAVTAWFYDILDYPWELQYRKWRPGCSPM